MKVIIRMWTKDEYHKDVAVLDEQQVRMRCQCMEPTMRHTMVSPVDAIRLVVDPKVFPEAIEFEVIVQR